MKIKKNRQMGILFSILYFGLTVFSAGYLYLDNRINGVSVYNETEKVPYFAVLPENTTLRFKICGDSILVHLGFDENNIKIIFAETDNTYGYTVDYNLNCDYKIIGYLVDAVGGIELGSERFTGVQIIELFEFSNPSKEIKKEITEKIVKGVGDRGFSKEDMLYIIENADTNLKFASAYLWVDFISELCLSPVFID